MAHFTVRVELHGGTQIDYQNLHAAMARSGFTQIIVSDSGIRYRLPNGEYNFEGDAAIANVLNSAQSAAALVGKPAAIFVSEVSKRTWIGLAQS